ncbi:CarD family transcriptional regulator [Rickettsiales endosymbiont of Stachyamoeba lipophora]|uniref:CarD family transcriptional regulator n=1 Tax=Rickettsiales endosymbiont of Stachyamoeba lipophora TaxID=2486578 RepID=UPI000F646281|nr:CarD family transcriptional regulator [Rickettsiales endosymbiont of Stachyamoeba lipophora]AZL15237.1 CarD family transcriptional regulator [Rickettsiales endosymbiont of Stachyamoeba lipophora]
MVKVSFVVNDAVVYPSHGVGYIIAEEVQNIAGVELKVFVVEFTKEKMTLRVPIHRATACGLRPVLTAEEFNRIFEILNSKAKIQKGMWSRRAVEYENKINSGNLEGTAEVVRDLFKNVNENPDCSYSERMIYEMAITRLSSEYAAVQKQEVAQSIEYFTQLLREKEIA